LLLIRAGSLVKNGEHQDAEEFLGLYLEALDKELVELHAHISTHGPASVVEELEGLAQSGESQTNMGERYYAVRYLFSPAAPSLVLLTYAWTRIGKFSRDAHVAYIRWKVPFDRTRAKPARHYHYRSLAIASTHHPSPCLLVSPFHPHICPSSGD
jgi:hypothetical protein